jgi:hypothetical protein
VLRRPVASLRNIRVCHTYAEPSPNTVSGEVEGPGLALLPYPKRQTLDGLIEVVGLGRLRFGPGAKAVGEQKAHLVPYLKSLICT